MGNTREAIKERSNLAGRLGTLLFAISVSLLLYQGWLQSGEHHLTAEEGVGYLLGITGASLMVALLLYPLRKKANFMRRMGPIHYWFRLHMLFGVVGPVTILFHANFNLGSLNSQVALFCMLLVASSGLVGRYFYKRIHFGLYGQRATLAQLSTRLSRSEELLIKQLADDDATRSVVDEAIREVLQRSSREHSLISQLGLKRQINLTTNRVQQRVNTVLKRVAEEQAWPKREVRRQRRSAYRVVGELRSSMVKAAQLALFERLFSLWHIFHLPFFFMMVLSGVVHVVAVHMY